MWIRYILVGFALAWTAYQVYRGVRYYKLWLTPDNEKHVQETDAARELRRLRDWRKRDKVSVIYVQVGVLYGFSTVAGIAAWGGAYCFWKQAGPALDVGPAAFLVFLLLFGFVGVSGELAQWIQSRKLPGGK